MSTEAFLTPAFRLHPHSNFISRIWADAKEKGQATGTLFESLVASCLKDSGLPIFYRHARLLHAPSVEFDMLVWNGFDDSPWCMQLTSSLRERYKLADLQAFRVKAAYPLATICLLTMDQLETSRRKADDFEALDQLIYCGSSDFDDLIEKLRYSRPQLSDEIIESKRTQIIATDRAQE